MSTSSSSRERGSALLVNEVDRHCNHEKNGQLAHFAAKIDTALAGEGGAPECGRRHSSKKTSVLVCVGELIDSR